ASDAFYYCKQITEVIIGDGVVTIGSYAFYNCTSLAKVTFGRALKSIGYSAFQYAPIETIELPQSLEEIEGEAFYNCKKLTSANIPPKITELPEGLFGYCSKLETITGGDDVIRIGRSALTDTRWFKNQPAGVVYFGKVAVGLREDSQGNYPETVVIKEGTFSTADYFISSDYIYNVKFPSSLKEIGDNSFEACRNLNNVTLPQGLELIGNRAFDAALTFTEIDIPDNVKTLRDNAFSRSKNVTKLTIGKSVTSIGGWAFTSCTGIKDIYAYPDPDNVTLGKSIFSYGPTAETCTLHVKSEYLTKYQNADQWKAFMPNIVGDLEDRPDAGLKGDCNGDGVVDVKDVTALITYILGETPAGFVIANANVNGTGEIDVQDVTALINMILE
ncbi:MAG: leucine-rich repeat protein, partial [Muribaculaceae bacterium]|nr:leucine-rich repeat protein [Muribaculaceae bacterium]